MRKKRPIDQPRPDLRTLLDGADNALEGLEYPGDLQGDADVEMSAVLREIIAKKKADRERYRDLYDDDYYLIVVFQAARQKAQFEQLTRWPVLDGRFVDGLALADILDAPLDEIALDLPKHREKRRFKPKEVLNG